VEKSFKSSKQIIKSEQPGPPPVKKDFPSKKPLPEPPKRHSVPPPPVKRPEPPVSKPPQKPPSNK